MKEGAYNEWRIKGFDFKGIFIDDIHQIHAKQVVELTGMSEIQQFVSTEQISLDVVFNDFTDWNIYTFDIAGNLMDCYRK